jgi:dihydroorotase
MIVLKNVQLPSGERADIEIEGESIASVGSSSHDGIDCSGLIALPGFVDLHTHLREPGFEESETVLTGAKSAAAGGYTTIFAMANSYPVADTAASVEWLIERSRSLPIEIKAIGAVTKGLAGLELAELQAMADSPAEVRIFSDDGMCVFDEEIMRESLRVTSGFGGLIAQHSQNPEKTVGSQMNAGALAVELGLVGWPAAAEEEIIKRDIELALELDAQLHICHLTTAGAVEIVRWGKGKGARVTAEVTPHHLMLDEQLVTSYDPVFKVNPPLRSAEDALVLREALIDGTIDVVATDHAPHSQERKECEWQNAAFGMVGLENAASVVQDVLIESGGSTWERFAQVMSIKPAEIGLLSSTPRIASGSLANLALVDPGARRSITSQTHSKSKNNPFRGMSLPGRVVHTIFRGTFSTRDGEVQFG